MDKTKCKTYRKIILPWHSCLFFTMQQNLNRLFLRLINSKRKNTETYFEFDWPFVKKLLHSDWVFGAEYLPAEAPAARIEQNTLNLQ